MSAVPEEFWMSEGCPFHALIGRGASSFHCETHARLIGSTCWLDDEPSIIVHFTVTRNFEEDAFLEFSANHFE